MKKQVFVRHDVVPEEIAGLQENKEKIVKVKGLQKTSEEVKNSAEQARQYF
jgi:hypothetical protein